MHFRLFLSFLISLQNTIVWLLLLYILISSTVLYKCRCFFILCIILKASFLFFLDLVLSCFFQLVSFPPKPVCIQQHAFIWFLGFSPIVFSALFISICCTKLQSSAITLVKSIVTLFLQEAEEQNESDERLPTIQIFRNL